MVEKHAPKQEIIQYAPKQEVINFLERGLRSLSSCGKLADCLSTLTKGKVRDVPQTIKEIKEGSEIGKAFYYLVEHIYYNRF